MSRSLAHSERTRRTASFSRNFAFLLRENVAQKSFSKLAASLRDIDAGAGVSIGRGMSEGSAPEQTQRW